MRVLAVVASLLLVSSCVAVLFEEHFSDGKALSDRWVQSNFKQDEGSRGKFELSAGKWHGDALASVGLRTAKDFSHYVISTPVKTPFTRANREDPTKPLVIQYSVKHEQEWIECGGGFMKLFAQNVNPRSIDNNTPQLLTFGPDICGTQTRHVVFNFRGTDNKLYSINQQPRCEGNKLTHFYTLILRPDGTYEIRVDNNHRQSGNIREDFNMPDGVSLMMDQTPVRYVGIEVWQVRAGTIFDNFLITTSLSEAEEAIRVFEMQSRHDEEVKYSAADEKRRLEEDELRKSIEEQRRKQDEEIASTINEPAPPSIVSTPSASDEVAPATATTTATTTATAHATATADGTFVPRQEL